MFKIGLAV